MTGKPLRLVVVSVLTGVVAAWITGIAFAGTTAQPVIPRGTTTFTNTPVQTGKQALPSAGLEIPSGALGATGGTGKPSAGPGSTDRRHEQHAAAPLGIPSADSAAVVAGATAQSFNGISGFDQRYANGGNQFSVEPPDQGLCAGNGYVVETVNDVIGVYREAGGAQTKKEDLNTFYNYPAQIDRTTGAQGPQVTDPSCLYDPTSGKFIVDVLTYEVDASGNPTGVNHLDVAVSQTGDPNGTWSLYSIQAADDGTLGTPSHLGCPCLGDYPHAGLDANGYYLTTNEYSWFTDSYNGAQVYAISKAQLTGGGVSINAVHYDNLTVAGNPSFTVWPANANAVDWRTSDGGTEFFLSSMAGAEANNTTGIDNRIAVWRMTHTSRLGSTGVPELTNDVVSTETYAIPPASDQKATDPRNLPLLSCLNDRRPIFPPAGGPKDKGLDCSQAILGADDPYAEVQGVLDSNDSRMQQVWLVKGMLLGALDTAVNVGGAQKAGIAYFVFDTTRRAAKLAAQGYLAVAGNNVSYPAIATLPNGTGVMAFTLTGHDYFPSAAYATISPTAPYVGPVQIAAAGAGPQDGFSEYRAFSPYPDGVPRPRWGDYGAAVSDGNQLWFASEYIGQSCTYEAWLKSGFTCGETRGAFINWGTRISQLTP